jgi:hypothetical protein
MPLVKALDIVHRIVSYTVYNLATSSSDALSSKQMRTKYTLTKPKPFSSHSIRCTNRRYFVRIHQQHSLRSRSTAQNQQFYRTHRSTQ